MKIKVYLEFNSIAFSESDKGEIERNVTLLIVNIKVADPFTSEERARYRAVKSEVLLVSSLSPVKKEWTVAYFHISPSGGFSAYPR